MSDPLLDIEDHGFGRFDYFFADAEADHRTGLGAPVAALGAAAEPACDAWRRRLDPAAVWLAGEIAGWIARPFSTALGEDEAPLFPSEPMLVDATGAPEPLDRGTIAGRLANLAGGLPDPQAAPIEAVLAGLLILLAEPGQVALVARESAPLYAGLAARSEPMRRPRPVPIEAAFALLPLISGGQSMAWLMRVGHRLSMPTAQGALTALRQLDGASLPRLTEGQLAAGGGDGGLAETHGFSERSPLAWYLMCEGVTLGRKGRLGPLGSRLLSEAIIGLAGGLPRSDPAAAIAAMEALWQAAGAPRPPEFGARPGSHSESGGAGGH